MVGIVLISHGGLAEGVLSSASLLFPDLKQVHTLALWPADNPDEFQAELEVKISEADTGNGVFVLADILGGTPCNRAMYFANSHVRLLTGLSLTMFISLLCAREATVDMGELVQTVLEETSAGIVDVNELMKKGDN